MCFTIGDIAFNRTELLDSITLEPTDEYGSADLALERATRCAYPLVGGGRFHDFTAEAAFSRRDCRIREAASRELFGMFGPILVVGSCVTLLAKCDQVVSSVCIPQVLKKSVGYEMVAIKRIPRPAHSAMLTGEVVTFENREGNLAPILTSVYFSHAVIIAQSGGLRKWKYC